VHQLRGASLVCELKGSKLKGSNLKGSKSHLGGGPQSLTACGSCGCRRLPAAAFGSLWQPVASCGCLWQPVAVCGSLWTPVVVCCSLWQFATVCGRLCQRAGLESIFHFQTTPYLSSTYCEGLTAWMIEAWMLNAQRGRCIQARVPSKKTQVSSELQTVRLKTRVELQALPMLQA
jgi:hypothetical protein